MDTLDALATSAHEYEHLPSRVHWCISIRRRGFFGARGRSLGVGAAFLLAPGGICKVPWMPQEAQ